MNRLRVLSLTTLMLMLASRLPGQASENWGGQVVACNHGTIAFSVAQAYLYSKPFSGYQWQFEGWYNVDPGKCTEIGSPKDYHNGGLFSGKDSITLLAFAFYDSTGTWGVAKLSDPGNVVFHPSNQQFCVKNDLFRYNLDSPEGRLPRGCDGAQTGYQMIPASFEYTGPAFSSRDGAPFQKNDFFVTLSPSDRAIPLGLQTSSGGAAPEIATPGGFGNAADRAVLLEWVREDVAAYIEASKTGFAAYKKGDAQLSPGYRRWDSSVKPAAATGCLVVQGATTTTFSCVLSENTDLNGLRSYYAQLTKDITASLPRDWKPAVVPPFSGDLPTQGYRSSSGAHGEVWITRAKSGARYEIDFQLVSAH